MKVTSPRFKAKVVTALADPHLKDALGQSRKGLDRKSTRLNSSH